MTYLIQDWDGNVCFFGQTFKTFDDAEEFLFEKLVDDYETDREDYYIVQGIVRSANYLDPNDPRGNLKVHS